MTKVDPASMRIRALTRADADDICTWRYAPPYDVYDMTGATPDDLLDPAAGFHALDTGGGLRPELTGQGLGRMAIATGLAYGREHFAPAAFRVTVASFNTRALHTVTALGFAAVGSFTASHDGSEFVVLTRSEWGANL